MPVTPVSEDLKLYSIFCGHAGTHSAHVKMGFRGFFVFAIKNNIVTMWWRMPLNPAPERLRQLDLRVSYSYMIRPYIKTKTKNFVCIWVKMCHHASVEVRAQPVGLRVPGIAVRLSSLAAGAFTC